jgi:hypothetical protein
MTKKLTPHQMMEGIALSGDKEYRSNMIADIACAEMRRKVAEMDLYRCLEEERGKKARFCRIYTGQATFDPIPSGYTLKTLENDEPKH